MKNLFLAAVLCSMVIFVAGCGSRHYTITKTDGSNAVSVGAPEFSKQSDTYTYENLDGQSVTIKREDVKEIIQNKD